MDDKVWMLNDELSVFCTFVTNKLSFYDFISYNLNRNVEKEIKEMKKILKP